MSVSFAELRNNLGILASSGLSFGNLHLELQKLRQLRKSWFGNTFYSRPKYIEPKVFQDPEEDLKIDVVEKPIENIEIGRKVLSTHSSVSYNAERYLPYRILWAKVIIRATYDYALWKDSPDPKLRKFAEDAEKWLFESSDLELSFENICFAFDFPVEKIRQKTKTLTRDDVKKLEFRERQGKSDMI